MDDIEEPNGPTREETAQREQEEKERKAKELAEQALLPYKWTQNIGEAEVSIAVPGTIKGRDLDVVLTKTKIKVALKGQAPFIDVWTFMKNYTSSQHLSCTYERNRATSPTQSTQMTPHGCSKPSPRANK